MNIVLMAGGGGTRLWPLSRHKNPKQFLDLGTGKTLLELTYDRARALTDASNIYVATIDEYGEKVRSVLPDVPEENIFYEPERRDNAPAFASVAVQLTLKGKGEEPTVFMWADHVFTNEIEYIEDVKKVPQLIAENPEAVIILGHVPTSPETGFGYIEAGGTLHNETDIFEVKSFKEKPDLETATNYITSGGYFWNMGSISLRPSYLLAELRKHEPELMESMDDFTDALKDKDEVAAKAAYAASPKQSIDYALLEKTDRILVVTGNYGWSDIGNWGAVFDVFGTNGDHMPNGHHIHVDSKNNFIYNTTDRVVSLIGVKNMIVVVIDDAVLVTDKKSSHQVKEVVAKLKADKKDNFL